MNIIIQIHGLQAKKIQQQPPSITIKNVISRIDLFFNYLDANKEQQTYKLSTKKVIKSTHLYALLSSKFINRALRKLSFKKYDNPVRLRLVSKLPLLSNL